eukprot:CAMPEP_0172664822 /NCGR_PEP_ID=MMETSP1074-20121228/6855_1 /TAXON_ID=2916 /ORGANISM="Ceratium fusus, Strain PA161109" /LENGTH=203 /DNA_ID=CAMNT_0013481043 /DNA_START=60 /DNA_END=668 /DNA_ORIENTATION=+
MSSTCEDIFEKLVQQVRGPDDLVMWKNGRRPDAVRQTCNFNLPETFVVGLHAARITVAVGRRSMDEVMASATSGSHRYRLADGQCVSLLHLTIIFGEIDLTSVLANMNEYPASKLVLDDLGIPVMDQGGDQSYGASTCSGHIESRCRTIGCDHSATFWRGKWWTKDAPYRRLHHLNSKYVLGGAQSGRWVSDWSVDLHTARAH